MKRFYLMMVVVIVVLLVGCVKGDLKTNTVMQANLTDREAAILSVTSNGHFIYDFKVDNSYKKLSVWLEKYEAGQLVEEVNRISSEISKEGTIIFANSNASESIDPTLLSITIHSDQSSATGWTSEVFNEEELSTIWESYPLEDGISIDDELILASISYSSSETGMRTLSEEFYKNGKIDELANYDVVYVLKCLFY